VTLPQAVVNELLVGRTLGISLPDMNTLDWITIRAPACRQPLALVTDLGPGETDLLMLATELQDVVDILDDAIARRAAESLGLRLIGTLGLLLDAKSTGLIPAVTPLLNQLQDLGFRLAAYTRAAVLKLAGEQP
jgi:uncharacterized protein